MFQDFKENRSLDTQILKNLVALVQKSYSTFRLVLVQLRVIPFSGFLDSHVNPLGAKEAWSFNFHYWEWSRAKVWWKYQSCILWRSKWGLGYGSNYAQNERMSPSFSKTQTFCRLYSLKYWCKATCTAVEDSTSGKNRIPAVGIMQQKWPHVLTLHWNSTLGFTLFVFLNSCFVAMADRFWVWICEEVAWWFRISWIFNFHLLRSLTLPESNISRAWKTWRVGIIGHPFWGPAYFQGQAASFSECIILLMEEIVHHLYSDV